VDVGGLPIAPFPDPPHPVIIIVDHPYPYPDAVIVEKNWRDDLDGAGVVLRERNEAPNKSGFDFSEEEACSCESKLVDIIFERRGEECFMDVLGDADIEEVGPTERIEKIGELSGNDWSPSHDVQLRTGHSYLVWTWDNQFIEFRVSEMTTRRVVFDWMYQVKKPRVRAEESLRNGQSRPEIKIVMFDR
jgi:hypothetical protein